MSELEGVRGLLGLARSFLWVWAGRREEREGVRETYGFRLKSKVTNRLQEVVQSLYAALGKQDLTEGLICLAVMGALKIIPKSH